LNELFVVTEKGNEFKNVLPLMQKMANVKKAVETKKMPEYPSKELDEKTSVALNNEVNDELKNEWELMEVRRRIQEQRKKAGLTPAQKVELEFSCSDQAFTDLFKERIESETNTKIVSGTGKKEKLIERDFFISLKK
jgi:phosphopantetheine adenylyltransferase